MSDDPDFEYLIVDSTIVRPQPRRLKRPRCIRANETVIAGSSRRVMTRFRCLTPSRFRPHADMP